ncbi:unnamed protein product [Periconia digitata]|uniref:Uncharacterized protein n=1 Tax=Periconia digitata TaxID=1303443 RepID=A0A9W4U1W1_9PLEO|nr:unnamed protein product [Periconia digitata]
MHNMRPQSNAPKTNQHKPAPTSLPARPSITAPPVKQRRNALQLLVVLFYMALALLSWILFCVMTYKLRGQTSYYPDKSYTKAFYGVQERMRTNERYMLAARVIHTIATLLTIPVTTYVCTVAAMAYLQSGGNKRRLTVKQSAAVADQKWWSPMAMIYAGSLPLYMGFSMTLIGALSQLLQSGLVGQDAIRVASSGTERRLEFIDPLNSVDRQFGDAGLYILDLQYTLASSNSIYSGNLWVDRPATERNTRASYMTPFSSSFNTGVYPKPQFAPRINTTIKYEDISEEVFKQECRNETDSGAFYANYAYEDFQGDPVGFNIEVCITGDIRKSPWKITRDRQDFSEALYFSLVSKRNETRMEDGEDETESYDYPNRHFKVSAGTSFGYFELPSHFNNNTAGSLLDKDPLKRNDGQIYRRADNDSSVSYGGDKFLNNGYHYGPLTSLGLALFGYRSFIGARMLNVSSFVEPLASDPDYNCAYLTPLEGGSSACSSPAHSTTNVADKVFQLMKVLANSNRNSATPGQSLFETGLNITNYMFLNGRAEQDRSWTIPVNTDEGIATMRPAISKTGMILGSVFLGLHLGGILMLSVYCLFHKLTASRLGAELMLRLGVAHADLLKQTESEKERENLLKTLPSSVEGGSGLHPIRAYR